MKKNNTVSKIIKSFLITIISLFILVTVGAIVLINTVNPNNYKALIIKQIEQSTQQQVRIDGNIKWRFVPFFGLEAKKIVIENKNTLAPQKNFLSIGSIGIAIKLYPLLHERVIISKLIITDLDLNLMKFNQLNNWTLTIPDQLHVASDTHRAQFAERRLKTMSLSNTVSPASFNNKSNISLELRQFLIKNASISYTDLTTNKSYKLNNIDFNVDTGSSGIIDYKGDSLSLKNFIFRVNKTSQGIGSIKINNLSQHLSFSGSIKLLPFSLNKLLKESGFAKVAIPNRRLLENVSFETEVNGDSNSLRIKDFQAYLDNVQIKGNIAINSLTPCNIYDKLNINTFNLDDITSLNGFGLIMQGTSIEGDIHSNNLAEIFDLTKIALNQNIKTTDVRLVGFNINSFIKRFNSEFNINLSNIKDIQNALNAQPINNIKTALEPFTSRGPKDSSQRTDLGTLQVKLVLNHGILTTPLSLLSGPSETLNGSGDVNFNRKDIKYLINMHLKSSTKNMMIDQIIFPLQVQGPLSNIHTSLEWDSIIRQIINYQEKSTNKDLKSIIKHNAEQIKQGAANLFKRLFK